MSVTHNTRGVVLKTVAYGDTSAIVTILTELFGVQHYIVKGARTATKKQSAKMVFLQPSSLLDLVVYHNPLKHLNFIKEMKWAYVYQSILSNVTTNAVALYVVELMQNCLKQPDDNPELYYFAEHILKTIDASNGVLLANIPLYVALHFPELMGQQIAADYSDSNSILDLKEGCFVSQPPPHAQYVLEPASAYLFKILCFQQLEELETLALSKSTRKELHEKLEIFYKLHFPEFTSLKSLSVLSLVLGN
jgi:DNA repair protein RecO (recombination protein O)